MRDKLNHLVGIVLVLLGIAFGGLIGFLVTSAFYGLSVFIESQKKRTKLLEEIARNRK